MGYLFGCVILMFLGLIGVLGVLASLIISDINRSEDLYCPLCNPEGKVYNPKSEVR